MCDGGVWARKGDGVERDRLGNGYRLCILVDLNRGIRDRTRAAITGAFGVPGENDKGRRVVEFCAEKGLCMGNTYFQQRSLPPCGTV